MSKFQTRGVTPSGGAGWYPVGLPCSQRIHYFMEQVYSIERLSETTYKIVENDRFGQYPFLYVIVGVDKITVSGGGDYFSYVQSALKTDLPFLIICTHVHFDHVGGNHHFERRKEKLLGICMSSKNKTFSENVEINSLALAHQGASVKKFTVTRWLNEGDLIYLDDKNPSKENSLEILITPGHTPDSISIYAHHERRLFIGDNLYPFTAIHLDCLGSNLTDYIQSLQKIITYLSAIPKGLTVPSAEQKSTSIVQSSPNAGGAKEGNQAKDPRQNQIDDFLAFLGLNKGEIAFDIGTLLDICNGSVEDAVNLYCTSPDDVVSMCPKIASNKPAIALPQSTDTYPPPNGEIRISCGHVEANLPASSLQQMLDIISMIKIGVIAPTSVDSGYGEFQVENFTVMVPMKDIDK